MEPFGLTFRTTDDSEYTVRLLEQVVMKYRFIQFKVQTVYLQIWRRSSSRSTYYSNYHVDGSITEKRKF
jgi:hypothetical protein